MLREMCEVNHLVLPGRPSRSNRGRERYVRGAMCQLDRGRPEPGSHPVDSPIWRAPEPTDIRLAADTGGVRRREI